eukprot:5383578-Prymnesium_polylepis.1
MRRPSFNPLSPKSVTEHSVATSSLSPRGHGPRAHGTPPTVLLALSSGPRGQRTRVTAISTRSGDVVFAPSSLLFDARRDRPQAWRAARMPNRSRLPAAKTATVAKTKVRVRVTTAARAWFEPVGTISGASA